jgi:hypothetical protein
MDPKVLAVLGMGGLMCFLFLIVGIVAWINSEEDDSSSGSGSGSSSSSSSGSDSEEEEEEEEVAHPPDPPLPDTDSSGGDTVTTKSCVGGYSQYGYAGTGTGGAGDPANAQQWELRQLGWGCVENPWADIVSQEENCPTKYAYNRLSSTGYSQCKWSDDRVAAAGNVRCVPDTSNDCEPVADCAETIGGPKKKCCDDTGKWQGQSNWNEESGQVENCTCRGEKLVEQHSGLDSAPHVWRCN